MHIKVSAESTREALESVMETQSLVERYLNAAFSASSLRQLDCTLLYVPIIMPEDLLDRYPSRSRLRKKLQTYECAPQLKYEPFVVAERKAQLSEYLQGLAEVTFRLRELGASPEQVSDFHAIISGAAQVILDRLRTSPTH